MPMTRGRPVRLQAHAAQVPGRSAGGGTWQRPTGSSGCAARGRSPAGSSAPCLPAVLGRRRGALSPSARRSRGRRRPRPSRRVAVGRRVVDRQHALRAASRPAIISLNSSASMVSRSSRASANVSTLSRLSCEDRARPLELLVDDAPDLGVDLLQRLLAVELASRPKSRPRKTCSADLLVGDRAHLVAHAEAGDHRARAAGDHLDVAVGAGEPMRAQEDLLGHAAAEGHADDVLVLLRGSTVVLVLLRQHRRSRPAPGRAG